MGRDLNERDELRTERLLLRPFEFGDVDDVASYASDPEVGRYLPLPQPYTRDDAVEFIAHQVLAEWSTRPTFAIVLGGHAVGSVSLRVNAPNDIAEMGYLLGKAQWGGGLMPEAARAVMGWGFERYGLHKDLGVCGPEEPALVAGDGEAGHDPGGRPAGQRKTERRVRRRRLLRHPPGRVGADRVVALSASAGLQEAPAPTGDRRREGPSGWRAAAPTPRRADRRC